MYSLFCVFSFFFFFFVLLGFPLLLINFTVLKKKKNLMLVGCGSWCCQIALVFLNETPFNYGKTEVLKLTFSITIVPSTIYAI